MNDKDGERKAEGRREARKAERHRAILAAARVSFLERGYAGTSMSGLLGTAAGSKATLWKHFRSKEELFAAVIDDITAEFRAEVSAALAPDQGLGRNLITFCSRFITVLASDVGMGTLRLISTDAFGFPEVGRIVYERAIRPTEAILIQVLERGIAAGQLVPRPVSEMVDVLLNICAGRQQRMIIDNRPPEDVEALARFYVEIFLRAFGAGVVLEPPIEGLPDREDTGA